MWIICDIDGVLADPSHRLHFILGEEKDWDGFFEAAHLDAPRSAEIALLNALSSNFKICLLTGRSDRIWDDTYSWLAGNGVVFDSLYMRSEGDHRQDAKVKPELLERLKEEHDLEDSDILCVIEDRKAVVEKWRKLGFLCFQNAPGDF